MDIEHELSERPLQPRETFFQNNKTRARQFGRSLEIHLAQRFAKLEVLLRRESVITFGAEAMMLDVVFFIFAVRHFV